MENINKIQIVPDEVYEIGADKAPVIPEWSVKDDETLRKKVDDLAHSTFCGYQASGGTDPKKFTKSQNWSSGIITDDGIASGMTNDNNYLSIPIPNFGSKWKVKFAGTITENKQQCFFTIGTDANHIGILCRIEANGHTLVAVNFHINESWQAISAQSASAISLNTFYYYELEFTGTQYIHRCSTDKENWTVLNTIDYSTNIFSDLTNFWIGRYFGKSPLSYNLSGSTDLKEFSVEVDGIEVFSGNKTGIDTIKPDDYTVVGTPTISDDGVVSGFSDSNYLITPDLDLENANSWEIQVPLDGLLGGDGQTGHCLIGKFTYGEQKIIVGRANTTAAIYFYAIKNNVAIGNCLVTYSPTDGLGTIKVGFNGNKYYLTKIINGQSVTAEFESTEKIDSMSGIYIGYKYQGNPIDLNAFKIYADGNLVYQPCLKIPYTESKGNKKVVDKKYRDRVKDLFEQEGYNIYYTLGEDDFTLPSNKPNDIVKYKANGLTVAEQRADQTLTIRGACESGTDVNLPMDFFDADSYAVFGVGTTGTNTASKFTPAADGNYIAIGKGKV